MSESYVQECIVIKIDIIPTPLRLYFYSVLEMMCVSSISAWSIVEINVTANKRQNEGYRLTLCLLPSANGDGKCLTCYFV